SPYSLPSLQHHPPHAPDGPLFNTSSPNLPSLGPAASAAQSSTQQYTAGPGPPTNRLQPLNQWLPSRQAPYSQSLLSINAATTSHNVPLLPPPGSVNPPVGAAAASPPMTVDGAD